MFRRWVLSALVLAGWSLLCLYPGYWHATLDNGLWSNLRMKWRMDRPPWSLFFPLDDLWHQMRFPVHNAALMNRPPDVVAGLAADPSQAVIPDGTGRTALEYAVYMGHLECATPLLAAGAPVETSGIRGTTPLTLALNNNHRSMEVALLRRGARVDTADAVGVTPLHRSAALGIVEAVRAAASGGVSLDLLDRQGRTPLEYAALAGNLPMVMELVMAGAAGETREPPKDPLIAYFLALCRKTGDPVQAARVMAEEGKSSSVDRLKDSWKYPAELPIDDRPVRLR